MNGNLWSGAETETLKSMLERGDSDGLIAAAFPDKDWQQIRCKVWRLRHSETPPAEPEAKPVTGIDMEVEEREDTRTVTVKGLQERISSLEDLVRVCEIDTEAWEIARYAVKAYQGYIKNDQKEIETVQLYSVTANLKAKSPLCRELRAELARIANEFRGRMPEPLPCGAAPSNGALVSINLHDLHVGKYAWGRECGADYDVEIAETLLLEAVGNLLAKLKPWKIGRFALTVGSDLLNSDNSNDTTAHGTIQTTDGRHKRTFSRAWRLMRRVIDNLRTVAPVHVVIIPGNHDLDTAFAVGEILSVVYENDDLVTLDNGPAPRKYVEFGKCLIGYTHGDGVKPKDLANTMAEECAEAWGRTFWRCFETGHLHQQRVTEFPGVIVRINPALCAPEDWHMGKAFVGNIRSLQAQVWDRWNGNVASLSSDPVTPAKATVFVA